MSSVTGQVLATEETFRNVAGFPTEATLASKVLDLPALTQGKVLCDAVSRSTEAGKLVKFAVEHGKGKWFSRRDTFSVLDYEGEPFDDLVVVEHSNIIGKTRIVVQDKDEKPVRIECRVWWTTRVWLCVCGSCLNVDGTRKVWRLSSRKRQTDDKAAFNRFSCGGLFPCRTCVMVVVPPTSHSLVLL